MSKQEQVTSTWIIYWWANIGRKIQGSDTITVKGDSFDEMDADELLSYYAYHSTDDTKDMPTMPNFDERYNNADFCIDFGVRKIKRVKA